MKKTNLGVPLVLLVFAVFMVSVLMVLLTGADVLQGITERSQKNYGQRIAAQYLSTRVRQADGVGEICVRTTNEGDRLVLMEDVDGYPFETTLYCHDGYLRELFCVSGYDPGVEFGEKILPAEHFSVTDHGEYLEMELTFSSGEACSVILQLRSERGVTS